MAVIAILAAVACSENTPEESNPLSSSGFPRVDRRESERFAQAFQVWMKQHNRDVTKEQLEAVTDVHPYLVATMADKSPIDLARLLRNPPEPLEIPWNDAARLIRDGKVSTAMQAHNLTVWIETNDGGHYRTKEPRIDEVLRVIEEVDPKRKFIAYGTE